MPNLETVTEPHPGQKETHHNGSFQEQGVTKEDGQIDNEVPEIVIERTTEDTENTVTKI